MEEVNNGDLSRQGGAYATKDLRTTVPIEGPQGSVDIASTTHKSLDESVKKTLVSETHTPQNAGHHVGANNECHTIFESLPQNASSSQASLHPGTESKVPVQMTSVSMQQPTQDQKISISMPPLPPPSDDPMPYKMPFLEDQMPPLESVDQDQIPSLYTSSSHSTSLLGPKRSSIVPIMTSVESENKVSNQTVPQINIGRKHMTSGASSGIVNLQENSVPMIANKSKKGNLNIVKWVKRNSDSDLTRDTSAHLQSPTDKDKTSA